MYRSKEQLKCRRLPSTVWEECYWISKCSAAIIVLALGENTDSMPSEGFELFYVPNTSLGVVKEEFINVCTYERLK